MRRESSDDKCQLEEEPGLSQMTLSQQRGNATNFRASASGVLKMTESCASEINS